VQRLVPHLFAVRLRRRGAAHPPARAQAAVESPAKAVFQERLERHLLLPDVALAGNLAVPAQIDHRADAGGRGDLDRTPHFTSHLARIDLTGIADLYELPLS